MFTEEVQIFAGKYNSHVILSPTQATNIFKLHSLFVHALELRQGLSKELLTKACTYADDRALTLELTVAPFIDGRLSQEGLVRLYSKFGFVVIDEFVMRRTPSVI